ncbi:hypothetical protein IscW_ISCW010739 [Ixodes scapularis]|uniref:Ig-like domain-containing protein n=1 Tax=Ixodes scapularis TaxID=6945 RepID=B7Q5S8_IXOSC|nr:hypothetical protein IscW_ISCW010739 [Ixodes scapularis]|eukprot:XP_002402221.1 hypothetical protein IscW_ISCW010739 [Ixodes scapularis]
MTGSAPRPRPDCGGEARQLRDFQSIQVLLEASCPSVALIVLRAEADAGEIEEGRSYRALQCPCRTPSSDAPFLGLKEDKFLGPRIIRFPFGCQKTKTHDLDCSDATIVTASQKHGHRLKYKIGDVPVICISVDVSTRSELLFLHYSTCFRADKPLLSVDLGPPFRNSSLIEGSDLFLECKSRANPPVTDVGWRRDGVVLVPSGGPREPLVNDNFLAIQKLSRHDSGNYSCFAGNSEGVSESGWFDLRVQYRERSGDEAGGPSGCRGDRTKPARGQPAAGTAARTSGGGRSASAAIPVGPMPLFLRRIEAVFALTECEPPPAGSPELRLRSAQYLSAETLM